MTPDVAPSISLIPATSHGNYVPPPVTVNTTFAPPTTHTITTTSTSAQSYPLPNTGFNAAGTIGFALLILLVGVALVIAGRRMWSGGSHE